MSEPLGAFIAAEARRAETDLQVFRARALSVVGVAGALVTLVGGFLAIAAGGEGDFLPASGRWTVLVALIAYVLAAVAALVVNSPMKVDEANAEELLKFTQNSWGTEGWDQRVAEVSAKYLVSLRKLNAAAAWWLTASIGLEITGIAATAVTALLVVQHLS